MEGNEIKVEQKEKEENERASHKYPFILPYIGLMNFRITILMQ